MTSERVGHLIDKLPELRGLNRQVRDLLDLHSALAKILPGNLASSTTVAFSATGEAVLFADNGAAAGKLRQLAPRILVFLRQRGTEVTGIRVQVQVRIRDNPLPQKQIFLSAEARRAISQLSAKLEASPLRTALERLGHRQTARSDGDRQPLDRVQSKEDQ